MENQPPPTATARVTYRRTKAGKTILKVAVISADSITWRTYRHEVGTPTETVVAAALKSCGLASAWVWGSL